MPNWVAEMWELVALLVTNYATCYISELGPFPVDIAIQSMLLTSRQAKAKVLL